MSWDLKERSIDAVTLVEVSGEVALGGGSGALEAEPQELIVNGRDAILFDCSQVTSTGSSGIGAW